MEHEYQPLNDNEIRILELHPGGNGESLTCNLQNVPLDNNYPPFKALSYT